MTADELQRIVVRLANQCYVRYWLHWNYPVEEPIIMAIQLRDWAEVNGITSMLTPIQCDDLEDCCGITWNHQEQKYLIERTE